MLFGRADAKPWVGASVWINNEVWKRLVERSNGVINVFVDDEERVC